MPLDFSPVEALSRLQELAAAAQNDERLSHALKWVTAEVAITARAAASIEVRAA